MGNKWQCQCGWTASSGDVPLSWTEENREDEWWEGWYDEVEELENDGHGCCGCYNPDFPHNEDYHRKLRQCSVCEADTGEERLMFYVCTQCQKRYNCNELGERKEEKQTSIMQTSVR